MIAIEKLTKDYKKGNGNFDISFEIPKGQSYGIIGPNGAGKTTLIRQILGFIKPTSGSVKLNGVNPFKESEKIMEFTGYIAGEISLFENLKGIEYIKMVFDYKKDKDWEFVEKCIEHFDIDTSIKIKKMSKGMKQKIAIISAVSGKPEFLVLDEPTSGLDPVMQEQFNDLILMLKKEYNATIFICSHIFQEIAVLCDRVGIIEKGRLIKEIEVKGKTKEEIDAEFSSIYKRKKVF